MLLFLLFLHFHSIHFPFSPVPLFIISSIALLPFSGRWLKMTYKGWHVIKPQLNQSVWFTYSYFTLNVSLTSLLHTSHYDSQFNVFLCMLGFIAVGGTSNCRSRGHRFESQLGHIIFVEICHEIISTVILSLPLIQEGQLSVSGERMCTSTGLPLRGLSLPRKKCN